MIGLKKHDMKTLLKVGAKAKGVSLSEFRPRYRRTLITL